MSRENVVSVYSYTFELKSRCARKSTSSGFSFPKKRISSPSSCPLILRVLRNQIVPFDMCTIPVPFNVCHSGKKKSRKKSRCLFSVPVRGAAQGWRCRGRAALCGRRCAGGAAGPGRGSGAQPSPGQSHPTPPHPTEGMASPAQGSGGIATAPSFP